MADELSKAFRYGIDRPTENIATTLEALGFDAQARAARDLVDAPEDYESAAARFMNPGEPWYDYNWGDLPLATVEQSGQILGSLGLRAAGLAAGTAAGSPVLGAILAIGGPTLFEAVQVAGPVALARARNRDPQGVEKEPTWEDWSGALGTAGVTGLLNAIGVGGLKPLNSLFPKGSSASLAARRSTPLGSVISPGQTVKSTLSAGGREGVTEGLQGFTEQVGSTALTDKGLTINPKEAIGEGLIGGTAGSSVQALPATLMGLKQLAEASAVKQRKKEDSAIVNEEIDLSVISEEGPVDTSKSLPLLEEVPKEITNDTYVQLPLGATEYFPDPKQFKEKVTQQRNFVTSAYFDDIVDKLITNGMRVWPDIGPRSQWGSFLKPEEEGGKSERTPSDSFFASLNFDRTELSKSPYGSWLPKEANKRNSLLVNDQAKNVDELEQHSLHTGFPDTEFTRSPEFKLAIKEDYMKHFFGLYDKSLDDVLLQDLHPYSGFSRDAGAADITLQKDLGPTDYVDLGESGTVRNRIRQIGNNILFDKYKNEHVLPKVADQIKAMAANTLERDFSHETSDPMADVRWEQGIAQGTPIDPDATPLTHGEQARLGKRLERRAVKARWAQNLLKSVNFDTSSPKFLKVFEQALKTPLKDIKKDVQDGRRVVQLPLQLKNLHLEIEDAVSTTANTGLFENWKATFNDDKRFNELLEQKMEAVDGTRIKDIKDFKLLKPGDLNRVRAKVIKKVEAHPDIYNVTAPDWNERLKVLIADEVQNTVDTKKQRKHLTSPDLGIIEQKSNQPALKGKFTEFYPESLLTALETTPKQLENAEFGALDPNFLSYSVLRNTLQSLTNEGITSLPAASVLDYITKRYKKLTPELKQVVPLPEHQQKDKKMSRATSALSKEQRGETADLEARTHEAESMGITEYLQALGAEEVKIPYLENLVNDYINRFEVHAAKSWEDGIERDYPTISGPNNGQFEFVTTHVPLLPAEKQKIIDSGKASKKEIREAYVDSPFTYTERNEMHNWLRAQEEKYGIQGLGTVAWIRGELRTDNTGAELMLPSESQSYWIQNTRFAMSKAKEAGQAPSRLFRADWLKSVTPEATENVESLDALILEEESLKEPAVQDLREFIQKTPEPGTKNFPQGYWTTILKTPRDSSLLFKGLLKDMGRYFRRNDTPGYSATVQVEHLLKTVPNFAKKMKQEDIKNNLKEKEDLVNAFETQRPLEDMGIKRNKKYWDNIRKTNTSLFGAWWDITNDIKKDYDLDVLNDPELDRYKATLDSLKADVQKSNKALFENSEKAVYKEALKKIAENYPSLSEYLEVVEQLPSQSEVDTFVASQGNSRSGPTILPDAPFRSKFNKMALRTMITEALKEGRPYVGIPATVKKGPDGKKLYETETQEQHGQSGAPMGNYVSMLKEAESIAKEYGTPLQIVTIDVGGGNTGEVTRMDIRPLYKTVAEEGFRSGYKHGGLVTATKAQGAGYNINYADYGRSYT